MFGLGMQEIIVLAVLLGVGVGVVFLVLFMRGGDRTAALEEENRRLRDQNDRLRDDR